MSKEKLALRLANEGRVFSVELLAWQLILHRCEQGANLFCFVSTLRKPEAILKSFCFVQMSHKLNLNLKNVFQIILIWLARKVKKDASLLSEPQEIVGNIVNV